jgi:putative NADPH-quinone reductase
VGLLKLQAVLVITTANNPQEREVELYGDPLEVFWKKVVFGICGIPNVRRLIFAPVITSSPEQRAAWLEETRRTVAEVFGGG